MRKYQEVSALLAPQTWSYFNTIDIFITYIIVTAIILWKVCEVKL